jgi:single-strand DNA-binding protein
MTNRRTNTGPATIADQHHCNEVRLVGDLSREAVSRTLPDGTEVSSFSLRVRSESGTSDTVECVARPAALRARLAARQAGDTLEVTGSLRHRFWRGAAGTMSRYEVDVASVSLHRRGAVVIGRRSGGTPSRTPASA